MVRWCSVCGHRTFFSTCGDCGGSEYDTDDEVLDRQMRLAHRGNERMALRAMDQMAYMMRRQRRF